MKQILAALSMLLISTSLWAQAHVLSADVDLPTERARLAAERKAAEAAAVTDRAACYQQFVVQGCLDKSRQQLRAVTENVRRQEAAINDIERQRRGAAQLERLGQKTSAQADKDFAGKQADAEKSQKDREQRAADHAASRATAAAQAGQKQLEFEARQKTHADEMARSANRRAQAPTERARYEKKLQKAAERREDRERRAADRTRPRSEPLPAAPP